MTTSKDSSLKFFVIDRIGKTRTYLPQVDHAEGNIQEIFPGNDIAVTFCENSKMIYQWDLVHGRICRVFHHPKDQQFIKCAVDTTMETVVALDDNRNGYMWKLGGMDSIPVSGTASNWTSHVREKLVAFLCFQTGINLDIAVVNCMDVSMIVLAHGTTVVTFKDHLTAYLMFISEENKAITSEIDGIRGPFQHVLKLKNHQVLFISSPACYVFNSESRKVEWQAHLSDIVDSTEIIDVCYVESIDEVIMTLTDKLLFWKPSVDRKSTSLRLDGLNFSGTMKVLSSQSSELAILDANAKTYYTVDIITKGKTQLKQLSKKSLPIQHATLTPDGHYLLYVCNGKDLHLIRLSDGKLLAWYTMYDIVQSLSVSANSWYALVGTSDKRLFVLVIADPLKESHDTRIAEIRKTNRKYSKEELLMLIGDINDYLTEADDSYITTAKDALESQLEIFYCTDTSEEDVNDGSVVVTCPPSEDDALGNVENQQNGTHDDSQQDVIYTSGICSLQ